MLEVNRNTPYEFLPQYLSKQEAAIYLDLSEATIRKHIGTGVIPSKRIGKSIYVPKEFFRPDEVQVRVQSQPGGPITTTVKRSWPSTSALRRMLVREVAKDIVDEALDTATVTDGAE